MLVKRLHEFITALTLRESSLNQSDAGLLDDFKKRFSKLAAEYRLTHTDIEWLQSKFALRWDNIADRPNDYTFNLANTDEEWIALAKSLGEEINEPYLRVLIPVITNDIEGDSFSSLAQVSSAHDIYIGDDATWRSVPALFNKLQNSASISFTPVMEGESELITLTLNELYRLRNKQSCEEPAYGEYTSFWEYLTLEVVPSWQNKGKLNAHTLSLLCSAIEAFSQAIGIEYPDKFRVCFTEFLAHLQTCFMEDVYHLYSIQIAFNGKKTYLLEMLLDCMRADEALSEKLHAILHWISQVDCIAGEKNTLQSADFKPSRAHFDLFHLSRITEYSTVKFLPSFKLKLELIESDITKEGCVDLTQIAEIRAILSLPWQEIIDGSDEESLSKSCEYTTFWHYLINQQAKDWQKNGELPFTLLPELLNLIDDYYQISNDDDLKKFNYSLGILIQSLAAYPIEDINYFYGVVVEHSGTQVYLLQLLIECLQDAPDLESKLKSIVKWIYTVDHSLVANSQQLAPVYQDLQAGSYFNITQLRKLLRQLDNLPEELYSKLISLQQMASSASKIDAKLLENIQELYSLRWLEVIDSPLDYTRLLEGLNKPWISLAQCLAGARLIPANYYKFLIPTLSHDVEFISGNILVHYPLTHCILSNNNDELIYLGNCVEHHKANGTFYNCNIKNPQGKAQPLTEKERQRVLESSSIFGNYFKESEIKTDEAVIYKNTVDKIKELVEGSLFPIGLILGKDYNVEQSDSATKAYKRFLAFKASLRDNAEDNEHANLLNQRVLFNNKLLTFAQLMQQILNANDDEQACVATAGQYLLKLVIDYNPAAKFPQELEQNADVALMRLRSTKKVYRDYDFLGEEEAIRRLKIIYVALMTHPFKCFLRGINLQAWDCTNTVTNTGKEIADYLEKVFVSGSENARFAYAAIMENIVKPSLANKRLVTSWVRYIDTDIWLQTLRDNAMFKPANCMAFDPDLLLSVLWSYPADLNSKFRAQRDLFLEQLVHTLVQNENEHLKWIRINIKFAEFLSKVSEVPRTNILTRLRTPLPESKPDRVKHIIAFSCHQFAANIARFQPLNMLGLPSGDSQIKPAEYKKFRDMFSQRLQIEKVEDDSTVPDLLALLQKITKELIDKSKYKTLTVYIEKLTHEIPGPLISQPQIVW
jgi:hypothetical protein